jgi:hypothetical protein
MSSVIRRHVSACVTHVVKDSTDLLPERMVPAVPLPEVKAVAPVAVVVAASAEAAASVEALAAVVRKQT